LTRPVKGASLTLMLTAVVGLFLWLTLGLSPNARRVPLVVAIPTLGLLVIQLLMDLVPSLAPLRRRLEKTDVFGIESHRETSQQATSRQLDQPAEGGMIIKREFIVISWIFLLLVSIYLFGFLYAVPIFMLFYLRERLRENRQLSLAVSIGTWAILYGVFLLLLGVQLYEGRLWQWLGLLI